MPALLHIFVNSFFVQRCTNIAGRFKVYITFPVRAVGVMGYRRGVWQTNISPWDSHLPCKASDWKSAGSFLFCLLVCLSYILSSSLCFHSFSSIAPFFIPYVFFFFFVIQNYLAGMKQSAINIPTLYTEPVLKHIGLYMLGGRAWGALCLLYVLLPGDSDDKYLVSVMHSW